MERERRRQALAPPPPPQQQQQQQLEDVVQQAAAGQGNESGGADAWEVEVAVAKAMAAAVAAAGGGIAGGAVPELSAAAAAVAAAADGDGDGLEDVPEGTDEGQKEEARIGKEVVGSGGGKKRRPCARASFSVGGSGLAGGGGPDWSPNGGANGTFPLRRALTFGEVGGGHGPCSPADSGGGRLREVPLSEAQAMAESLRAWRQSFDVRNAFFGESGDGDAEEDRGRAVSLQVQSRSFARRGRATALVTSRTKWTSDVVGGGEGSSGVEAKGLGLELGGRSGGEEGSGAMAGGGGAASDGSSSSGGGCVDRGQRQDGVGEKTHRTLSDQEWSSSRRIVEMAASEAASLTNPVMAAFERERKEAAARQAEVEDAQAARAAAMVKQAAAAAKAGDGEVAPAAAAAASAAGTAEDDGELHVGSVVRLGLNDAPGSAAAASAAGLRIAAEGISNLSLRSRDSVENLQERGEQSWGPLPLSSSA
ncbi:hypothetical protein Esi_0059_0120 [Ectocarpus siliculosus]|uniref:Uncharacterized protein n=1 Tax=Ectocarpus siliculosus TaxID=2880 RepID=D8LQA1_ECTSI|nr:hypothetical protein Esi_0059_0120 [Ectocarpus siliculosus]|eukprot:CBN77481.1 hypothetical protein Esi_0059_0120 [Ectocarpus siliculosus]